MKDTIKALELGPANASFLKDIDTVIFDCDGVLWDSKTSQRMDGANEVLEKLREMNKRVFFISNNSTKTRKEYAAKIIKAGIQASEEEIICTAWLVAAYLKDVLKIKGKTYLVGGTAMETEFRNKGLEFVGSGVDTFGDSQTTYTDFLNVKLDSDIEAVAVGFDACISYLKVLKAASYLQRPFCKFVGCNTIPSYCVEKGGIQLPVSGSILNFVATAACREPVIVGKPSTLPKEILESIHGKFNCERTLMVGDRLQVDMKFANRCGFRSLLVLTGVTTLPDLAELMASDNEEDRPSFYTQGVGDLRLFLNEKF